MSKYENFEKIGMAVIFPWFLNKELKPDADMAVAHARAQEMPEYIIDSIAKHYGSMQTGYGRYVVVTKDGVYPATKAVF